MSAKPAFVHRPQGVPLHRVIGLWMELPLLFLLGCGESVQLGNVTLRRRGHEVAQQLLVRFGHGDHGQ